MNHPTHFEGHANRECGEHRTVGSHRAWCHDCTEWCYPEIPCRGCKIPQLELALTEANKLLEQTIEVLGIALWALDSAELNTRIADDEHVRRDARVGITKAQSELKPLLDNLKAREKNHGSA